MTPAEEDALFAKAIGDYYWNYEMSEAIRLAIRAAEAHERERAIGRVEDCLRGSHWDAERLAVVAAIAGEPS